MRKHLIGNVSRNYASRYCPYYGDWYEFTDIHRKYNRKYKPHSNWGGRKPMWRAKRKEIRKFKLEDIIEARKRRLNRESKGTDEEYYRNLLKEYKEFKG